MAESSNISQIEIIIQLLYNTGQNKEIVTTHLEFISKYLANIVSKQEEQKTRILLKRYGPIQKIMTNLPQGVEILKLAGFLESDLSFDLPNHVGVEEIRNVNDAISNQIFVFSNRQQPAASNGAQKAKSSQIASVPIGSQATSNAVDPKGDQHYHTWLALSNAAQSEMNTNVHQALKSFERALGVAEKLTNPLLREVVIGITKLGQINCYEKEGKKDVAHEMLKMIQLSVEAALKKNKNQKMPAEAKAYLSKLFLEFAKSYLTHASIQQLDLNYLNSLLETAWTYAFEVPDATIMKDYAHSVACFANSCFMQLCGQKFGGEEEFALWNARHDVVKGH